jgi:hypothetical protein
MDLWNMTSFSRYLVVGAWLKEVGCKRYTTWKGPSRVPMGTSTEAPSRQALLLFSTNKGLGVPGVKPSTPRTSVEAAEEEHSTLLLRRSKPRSSGLAPV